LESPPAQTRQVMPADFKTEGQLMTGMTRKRTRQLFIFSMLAYPVLHYLIFNVYVNIQTIIYAFKRWNAYTGNIDWVNFANFTSIFELIGENYVYRTAVVNTLLWIPLHVLVMIPLSIAIAYLMSLKIKFHNFYRVVLFFPTIISIVVITMVFSFAVSPTIGIVNSLLGFVGLEHLQHSWLGDTRTALWTVFFFCVWSGTGLFVAILLGAITRIPEDLFEVAKLEGITRRRELQLIVIPLIWPTITTLIVIGTGTAFTVFLQSKLLTNGGPNFSTNTVTYQIVTLVGTGEFGLAAALGVLLGIVGMAVTYVIKYVVELRESYEY